MPYSCIKRQSMKIYKAGYSRCIIEKDVKVNIMRFRTLRSIEFQGLCSLEFFTVLKLHFWNLRPISFLPMTYSCLKRQSMKIYKAGYSRCIIEKDVKVNIMLFRT